MRFSKCVIYGAGINCKKLLTSNLINIQDVVYIVDSDAQKNGEQLCGVKVFPPVRLKNDSFNWVIITTKPWNYYDVYDLLIHNMNIERKKIVFYNPDDEKIMTDKEASGYSFRFHLYQQFKREYTMGELLYEAAMADEFEGYDRVLACGKWDSDIYKSVCAFFDNYLNRKIIVEEETDNRTVIEKTDKLLLLTKAGAEDIHKLSEKYHYELEQLLVIPVP